MIQVTVRGVAELESPDANVVQGLEYGSAFDVYKHGNVIERTSLSMQNVSSEFSTNW